MLKSKSDLKTLSRTQQRAKRNPKQQSQINQVMLKVKVIKNMIRMTIFWLKKIKLVTRLLTIQMIKKLDKITKNIGRYLLKMMRMYSLRSMAKEMEILIKPICSYDNMFLTRVGKTKKTQNMKIIIRNIKLKMKKMMKKMKEMILKRMSMSKSITSVLKRKIVLILQHILEKRQLTL